MMPMKTSETRDKNKVVTVDIYSWAGLSLGAIHYYADLSCGGRTFYRITRKLTTRAAASINKRLRLTCSDEMYEYSKVSAGKEDGRFDREEQAIEAAKAHWLDYFPEADVLVSKKTGSVLAKRER